MRAALRDLRIDEKRASVLTDQADETDPIARVRAAARAYVLSGHKERREKAVTYLFELADLMSASAGEDTVIAPLLDIIPFVANPIESSLFGERRANGSPASDTVLARAAVAVDVFAMLGHPQEEAAQIVARQLINGRVRLPDEGDDPRGWKRLLLWRDRLVSQRAPEASYEVYVSILRELERLPKNQVRALAYEGRLWNTRAWRES